MASAPVWKIRKTTDDDQVLDAGPGHVALWATPAGSLLVNHGSGPEEVGSGGGGGGETDQLDLRISEPSGTADTVWVQHTGTSPTKIIALKVRIDEVVYTLASITV